MKTMKLLSMLCLVLAVSVTARGITFNQPWNGPIVFHLSNYDSGSVYTGAPGTYGVGGALPLGTLAKIPGPGALPGEDSWGLFVVDQILKGKITGPNTIVSDDAALNKVLWSPGSDGKELVGMFYGLQDISVTIDGLGKESIEGVGLTIDLYEQDYNTFALAGGPTLGSADRLGLSTYDGVGTAGNPSLWLKAVSTPGFLGSLAPGITEFVSNYQPNIAPPGVAGDAKVYVSLVPGSGPGATLMESNFFVGAGGQTADIFLNITTKANNPLNIPGFQGPVGDWTVTSTDDTTAIVIPEPVTMLSLGLAGMGLGGYIRRRRAA